MSNVKTLNLIALYTLTHIITDTNIKNQNTYKFENNFLNEKPIKLKLRTKVLIKKILCMYYIYLIYSKLILYWVTIKKTDFNMNSNRFFSEDIKTYIIISYYYNNNNDFL